MTFVARIALLSLAAFAALTSAAAAANGPKDDLGSLLDRMRARSGPVWRTHTTSTSRVTMHGEATEFRSDALGIRFTTYQCASSLCVGNYFDGERVASVNINGTTLPVSEAPSVYLRGERTVASLAFLAPDFTRNGGTIVDEGMETLSGGRYRSLLVENGDAIPMLIYVDPKTALVRYIRDINGDATFEYGDYRPVDTLTLPFLVLRNGNELERYHTRATTTEAFAPPHGPQPLFSGTPAAIRTDPERAIPTFPCSIAGVATTCLLDSGNSGLSISLELAEELHAAPVGSFQVRGLGDYATEVVRAGPLQVGNARFASANYVVLHDIRRFGYDVVLGADVLASTTVALDSSRHTITFGAVPPARSTSVPLVFQNFVPVLQVHLGDLGAQLALDTGDESTINLSYDFYSQHRDLFSATEQRPVAGVGGSSVELIGTIPEVRVGDLSVRQQAIGTTQMLHGTAFGHLGAGFLEHFTVFIDYAAGEVHFVPTPEPKPSPERN